MLRMREKGLGLFVLSLGLLLTGCLRTGPKTVVRDRFDYNTAIGNSLKDQMLLNIVKLRYLDVPVWVEVAQIINSYEFQKSATIGGSLVNQGGDAISFAAGGTYANRPTITYQPLTGNQYIRGLVTPLPPETVFFAIQSGYAADLIIRATLNSVNGLRNAIAMNSGRDLADADFTRTSALMRTLQQAGALTLVVKVMPDKERVPLLILDSQRQSPNVVEAEVEVKRLLRLNSGAKEFRLVFGTRASSDTEIAVETRSLIQVLGALAALIDVPPEHTARGLAAQGAAVAPDSASVARLFHISSSTNLSRTAFAAVRYREHWYWIEDSDLASKRIFSILVLLFSFGDARGGENLPVLTVPVN